MLPELKITNNKPIPMKQAIESEIMTYIKKEDVQKILYWTYPTISIEIWKINSLPSINPEAMIKEMIEELACSYDVEVNSKIWKIAIDSHIQLLKELLQKFKS